MDLGIRPLPKDGAGYGCGFRVDSRDDYLCRASATKGVSMEYWEQNQDKIAFRAVCDKHLIELAREEVV